MCSMMFAAQTKQKLFLSNNGRANFKGNYADDNNNG